MSAIASNLENIKDQISEFDCTLVAVSKTKPIEDLQEAYDAGQRVFGENKVQELCEKEETLPKDIEWHMIGHLQTNKVKYIAPFVSLIHAVDSIKLLTEINKQGKKNGRIINCLLQVHIAEEQSKFGLTESQLMEIIKSEVKTTYENINVVGLMGMATNTEDTIQIQKEFKSLKSLFDSLKTDYDFTTLSMGMSGDFKIALESGSNMIRVGSSIFGKRNYNI